LPKVELLSDDFLIVNVTGSGRKY